jgi:ABC-2 type transport system ATP-binding protein
MKADVLPDNAIEAVGLDKVYAPSGKRAKKHALRHIDLSVPRGSLFGLLGPNGAGKSTFINILAGLVRKSSGTVRIWDIDIDRDPRNARAAIGVVPQELSLDPFFTPQEQLEVQAGLYGVPRAERRTAEILAALKLTDVAQAYARSLSGGMRRRLLIAKALVHTPPVLVLDEPTAGVDVELRQQLWAYVRELNAAGVTVVLTTHYLEEAERLCDRIAIINHGRVIACAPTAELIGRMDQKRLILTVAESIAALPPALNGFQAQLNPPHGLTVSYRPREIEIGAILAACTKAGLSIRDLKTEEPDLQDIFLALTRAGPAEDPAKDQSAG